MTSTTQREIMDAATRAVLRTLVDSDEAATARALRTYIIAGRTTATPAYLGLLQITFALGSYCRRVLLAAGEAVELGVETDHEVDPLDLWAAASVKAILAAYCSEGEEQGDAVAVDRFHTAAAGGDPFATSLRLQLLVQHFAHGVRSVIAELLSRSSNPDPAAPAAQTA